MKRGKCRGRKVTKYKPFFLESAERTGIEEAGKKRKGDPSQ